MRNKCSIKILTNDCVGPDLVNARVAHLLEHSAYIRNASGFNPGSAAEFFPIFCYSKFDIILQFIN